MGVVHLPQGVEVATLRMLPGSEPDHPVPIACHVLRERGPLGWTTVVARLWRPRDTPHCRLCPMGCCTVDRNGLCLVGYPEWVSDEDAPLHGL